MLDKQRFVLLLFLLVLTCSTGRTQTEPKEVVVNPSKRERQFNPKFAGKPEQKLEQAEHKLSDAFSNYDIKTLNDLLADDLEIMGLVTPNAKKSIIDMATASEKFKNEYRVLAVEKTDMRIQLIEGIGIVTGRIDIDYKTEKGSGSSVANFLDVWSKDKNGEWRCISMSTDGQKLIHYPTI
jgi:ketosteroid isomerase-like protein